MVCVSSHLPHSLHLVKNDLQLCNNTELVDRNKMAKNTHFSKRESNEKQTVLDFRWVVKKNAGNVMLVDWAQAAKTCSHHFWRGRKQDWDTIQRTKVVLQDSREKDCENGVDIFFFSPTLLLSHLREGFLNHSSGHQMVLQRQVWSMCCWSRQEDEGMRKWRGTSRPDNHHNSCAAKWLMAPINVARERERERRGCYICCGGEWCFALYKLEVRGNNSPHSFNGKNLHLRLQTLLHLSAGAQNECSSHQINGLQPGPYLRWRMFTGTSFLYLLNLYREL